MTSIVNERGGEKIHSLTSPIVSLDVCHNFSFTVVSQSLVVAVILVTLVVLHMTGADVKVTWELDKERINLYCGKKKIYYILYNLI